MNAPYVIRHNSQICRGDVSIACLMLNGHNIENGDTELQDIVTACNAHDALLADNARLRAALEECKTDLGALAFRNVKFAHARLHAITVIACDGLEDKTGRS